VGPRLAPAVLTREELRIRIARMRSREHGSIDAAQGWLRGDDAVAGASRATGRTPAAVLLGVVDRPEGPAILLTQRTEHLRDHAGQISFPGGRVEPVDPSVEAAALREAEEEIGLAPAKVEVLGQLTPYHTVTGFCIHPVVGWIEPPLQLRLDRFEVAEVFEVPLQFVLDPANHRRQSYRRGALTRAYYVLPYGGRFIWGATAGILVNFSTLLRAWE
jgi:8-oxo-dGTP pyrophosphatase MutT (NUDIX family)